MVTYPKYWTWGLPFPCKKGLDIKELKHHNEAFSCCTQKGWKSTKTGILFLSCDESYRICVAHVAVPPGISLPTTWGPLAMPGEGCTAGWARLVNRDRRKLIESDLFFQKFSKFNSKETRSAPQEHQATSICLSPQLQVAEALFQASIAVRLRATFHNSQLRSSIPGWEMGPNPLGPSSLVGRDFMPGEAGWKDYKLLPHSEHCLSSKGVILREVDQYPCPKL